MVGAPRLPAVATADRAFGEGDVDPGGLGWAAASVVAWLLGVGLVSGALRIGTGRTSTVAWTLLVLAGFAVPTWLLVRLALAWCGRLRLAAQVLGVGWTRLRVRRLQRP